MMGEEKTIREEFKITGEQLLHKVRELIHEGNIRRIIVSVSCSPDLAVADLMNRHLAWCAHRVYALFSQSVSVDE